LHTIYNLLLKKKPFDRFRVSGLNPLKLETRAINKYDLRLIGTKMQQVTD
jgi:hypothetical protein